MSTVPIQPDQAVNWCLEHVTPWTENAATLKLDPQLVAQFETLTNTARDKRLALVSARAKYRAAVTESRAAVKAMRTSAGARVTTIRATAKSAQNPQQIYTLGLIPAPADPAPRPAPGVATDFKTSLLQGGSITLTFRCPNPPRTGPVTYRVERRLVPPAGSPGPFEFYKNAKERTFTDDSIPRGTAQVDYRITAQTSTKDGDPALFGVQFGSGNQATVVQVGGAGKKVA